MFTLQNPLLTLAKRFGAGLEHRFQQIIQHAFLAGDDVHGGHYAGDDQQGVLVTAQVAFIRTNLNQVEALAFFIGDGVGADQFQIGFHAAIDGEVVGAELDHGFLPGMEEGHILEAHLGFDQQAVVQRDDFQNVAARLDDAADGVDLELLDHPAHRRGHGGAADPVLDRDAGGGEFGQLGANFIEFLEGIGAKAQFGFFDLAFDFGHRRFRSGYGQVGGIQRAAYFHQAATQTENLNLGNGTACDQRL